MPIIQNTRKINPLDINNNVRIHSYGNNRNTSI